MQLKKKVNVSTCFTIAAVCLWLEGFKKKELIEERLTFE